MPNTNANMGTGGHNVPLIKDDNGIRKLTPRECFNLQGFQKILNFQTMCLILNYTNKRNSVTVAIQRFAEIIYDYLSSSD